MNECMGNQNAQPDPNLDVDGLLGAILGDEDRTEQPGQKVPDNVLPRVMDVEAIFYDGTPESGRAAVHWDSQLNFHSNMIYRPKNPHCLTLDQLNYYLTKKGVRSSRRGNSREITPNRWIVRDRLGNIRVCTDQDFQTLYRPG